MKKKLQKFFKIFANAMKNLFTPCESFTHDTYTGNLVNKRGEIIGHWPDYA